MTPWIRHSPPCGLQHRGVLLDRDGVVNLRRDGYVNDREQVALVPGAGEAITRLKGMGFKVALCSNQGGVGKGYMTREALVEVTEELLEWLADDGAYLDGVFYCTHAPTDGCLCRKPRPGLLQRAALELGIDLNSSYFIGDMVTDMEAGYWAGVKTLFVTSGGETPPDYPGMLAVCADLSAAADWIRRTEWARSW